MANLGMRSGRTLLTFNNVSPLVSPFQIAQRSISQSTTLATAQGWVNTAITRQEILVITLQGLSASPGTSDWYITRFQSLINYCITQGIPIITMDDLYKLQSGPITIPEANLVTLTINQSTGGTITADPTGPYHYGDAVVLTADPDDGSTFTGWTGACSGTALTCNMTLNGDKTVGGTFETNLVTLTIIRQRVGRSRLSRLVRTN